MSSYEEKLIKEFDKSCEQFHKDWDKAMDKHYKRLKPGINIIIVPGASQHDIEQLARVMHKYLDELKMRSKIKLLITSSSMEFYHTKKTSKGIKLVRQ